MKKIFLLASMAISFFTFAQIKIDDSIKPTLIGKVSQGQVTLEKLDDQYSICYNDAKFLVVDSFKCFSFTEKNNDLQNLYQLIIKGFEQVPKDNIRLDLPNDKIELRFTKNLGIVSMQFHHFDKNSGVYGFSTYLTKKQINKLFGK